MNISAFLRNVYQHLRPFDVCQIFAPSSAKRRNGEELRTLTGHAGSLAGVAFAPNGKFVSTKDDRANVSKKEGGG